MFTGIVEEIGTVKSITRGAKSITLKISATKVLEDTKVGDSICTNGVCLTVTSLPSLQGGDGDRLFSADVMPQTMRMTSFSTLKTGDKVNLERALTLQTRLGGHIVSGHIDGIGRITRREQDDTALWLWIETSPEIMRYIIEQGSITVQGTSLTVAKTSGNLFSISLIPHTQEVTTLNNAKVGDIVNLENDVIAKYVEKLASVPTDTLRQGSGEQSSEPTDVNFYRNFMLK